MPVRSSNSATVLLVARRRCLVCEWEEVVEEAEGSDPIGAPCARCQAPTERIETIARRRHPNVILTPPRSADWGA
jgi:hypothetical protein